MVITPSTTKRPCFFRKVLGSSPWASSVPRVAVYTMTTPTIDTMSVAPTRTKSNGGTARREATWFGRVWSYRRFEDRIPAVTSPALAPLPALVGTVGPGRPGRRLALPPPGQVRREPRRRLHGHRPDHATARDPPGRRRCTPRGPLRRQGRSDASSSGWPTRRPPDRGSLRAGARVATMSGLVANVWRFFVFVVAGAIVLGMLGINLTPCWPAPRSSAPPSASEHSRSCATTSPACS